MPPCMNPPCPPPCCMCSMSCGASAGLSCAKTVAAASRLISKNFIVHIGTPLAWLVPNGMSSSYLHPVSSSCGLETGLLQEECSSSCSRPNHRSSTPTWNVPTVPTAKSFIRCKQSPTRCPAERPTSPLGGNLQLRAPASVAGLPDTLGIYQPLET